MKRFFNSLSAGLLSFALVHSAAAETSPIFINNSPMFAPPDIAPQVDATAFVNRSQFTVNSGFYSFTAFDIIGIVTGGSVSYDFFNTLNFTNTGSGMMSGSPGFRFDFVTNVVTTQVSYQIINNNVVQVTNQVTNAVRLSSSTFDNLGTISGSPTLLIYSTNINSPGLLSTTSGGIVRMRGSGVNLARGGVRAGQVEQFFFGGGFSTGSNYWNDAGVSDLYWGLGTNNVLGGAGTPMRLDTGFFTLPFPRSPIHQVLYAGSTFTNTISIPGFRFAFFTNFFFPQSDFAAFARTNQINPSNTVVQVVFVNTNSVTGDTNFSTDVRFVPNFQAQDDGGATAIVQFQMIDFDIIDRRNITNYVYFIDESAFPTNIFLARNLVGNTRKPNTYTISRGTPFQWMTAQPANAEFSPDLIWNSNYRSNAVSMFYAAYSAQIGEPSFASDDFGLGQVFTPPVEPTNMAGRIEIVSDSLNLDQTRLRAESFIGIRTDNLISNRVAQVDAPYLAYHLASVEPVIEITNMAPAAVRRLSGSLAAWTGIWTNVLTNVTLTVTNTLDTNLVTTRFHVLIVDNALRTMQPVVMQDFSLRANHVILSDPLRIGRSFHLEADSLHVLQGIQLAPNANWAATNVLRLRNLTNDGIIAGSRMLNFGEDRPQPFENIVNRGTISGAATFVRAQNLDNTGTLQATAGELGIHAGTFLLTGSPDNPARLIANSDIRISAHDMLASNSIIQAGGTFPGGLFLRVTNELSDRSFRSADGWVTFTNEWITTAGFSLLQRPAAGTLIGTRIHSMPVNAFAEVRHVWSAQDRGPVNEGFHNNHAVGHLILDGLPFTLFRFSGTGGNNALYVDYLELRNYATNYMTSLQVDPNFTIYFAHANIGPERLEARTGGRLRWVSSFTGPNSSTNITYPSGRTYTFNVALAQSNDIDSDGDGIVNSQDPTPFHVPGEEDPVTMQIASLDSDRLSISWVAPSHHVNTLEWKGDFLGANWQTLTNFTQGRASRQVTVIEPVTSRSNKLYRVRVSPVSP
jgi:hypothetical protein